MGDNEIINMSDETFAHIDEIICMPGSQYAKDYEVSIDRVQESKLQEIGVLTRGMRFFIKRSGDGMDRVSENTHE